MNQKIHREDFYNEDYPLNPQEEKEFQMSIKDTYWKIRARAYLLDIDIFGPKEYLQQQIELYLFRPTDKQLPSKRELLRISNIDLFEKKFGLIQDSKRYNS